MLWAWTSGTNAFVTNHALSKDTLLLELFIHIENSAAAFNWTNDLITIYFSVNKSVQRPLICYQFAHLIFDVCST